MVVQAKLSPFLLYFLILLDAFLLTLQFSSHGRSDDDDVTAYGTCIDEHPLCSFWASSPNVGCGGYSKAYMAKTCRGSCGGESCRDKTILRYDCKDLNNKCTEWSNRGECKTNLPYMYWQCLKTCSHCDDSLAFKGMPFPPPTSPGLPADASQLSSKVDKPEPATGPQQAHPAVNETPEGAAHNNSTQKHGKNKPKRPHHAGNSSAASDDIDDTAGASAGEDASDLASSQQEASLEDTSPERASYEEPDEYHDEFDGTHGHGTANDFRARARARIDEPPMGKHPKKCRANEFRVKANKVGWEHQCGTKGGEPIPNKRIPGKGCMCKKHMKRNPCTGRCVEKKKKGGSCSYCEL